MALIFRTNTSILPLINWKRETFRWEPEQLILQILLPSSVNLCQAITCIIGKANVLSIQPYVYLNHLSNTFLNKQDKTVDILFSEQMNTIHYIADFNECNCYGI